MSNNLVFLVPYHTCYAHIELVLSFASFADVLLFVYKWNPARHLVQEYFASSNRVQVHDFCASIMISELEKQRIQQRRVVVLLTASVNYPFGQSQLRYFSALKKHISCIVDVYSTGHCMYGCQSSTHSASHRLPITFTNYILNKDRESNQIDPKIQIVVCPSFSSKDLPSSLLSNKDIIEQILTFSFPHAIKLHPLTYPCDGGRNPLFSLSELEKENVNLLLTSKNIVPNKQTNTLKLIEHARVLICDSDSSIPFEALYFTDKKHILVYENSQQHSKEDDRRVYFHTFQNAQQMNKLIDCYFSGELECKTRNSHRFFVDKYDEPDGREIERLADLRKWMLADYDTNQKLDIERIQQEVKIQIDSLPTQMNLYAIGEHTSAEIDEVYDTDINPIFNVMLDNITDL